MAEQVLKSSVCARKVWKRGWCQLVQVNEVAGSEHEVQDHEQSLPVEARRDLYGWKERLAWLEWDAHGEKGGR